MRGLTSRGQRGTGCSLAPWQRLIQCNALCLVDLLQNQQNGVFRLPAGGGQGGQRGPLPSLLSGRGWWLWGGCRARSTAPAPFL